jgi:hypothetical protein
MFVKKKKTKKKKNGGCLTISSKVSSEMCVYLKGVGFQYNRAEDNLFKSVSQVFNEDLYINILSLL